MLGLGLGISLTGSSAVAFTPASLFAASEKGAWYDPSDLSTLWQDTAGTSAVTADGQSVARIDDKSGNGYHLTQGTADNRPLYKTDGALHWLLFDGTNDGLATSGGKTWAATSDFFMALGNQSNDQVWLAGASVDETAYLGVAQNNNVGANNAGVGTPTTLVNGAALPSEDRDGIYEAIGITNNAVLEVDGASIAFDALKIGNYSGFEAGIKIYGLIITPADTGRADLRTWLGAKAGIVL